MAQNGGNNFFISLIASLKKSMSTKQIKSDVKNIESSNIFIKLVGKLDTSKTRQTIKSQLNNLKNLSVNIAPTVNAKGVQTTTKQAVNNAQNVANKNKVKVSFDVDKQKLINQIKILGQQNSKLFSNSKMTAKYNQLLDSAKIAKSKSEVKALRSELSAFKTELIATSNSGMNWINRFKASISHFTSYFSGASFIYALIQQLRNAWQEAINLDTAFTDLIKVQDELSRSDYSDYLSEINKKAQELATTQQALIEGATEFSRSGYSQSEADELSEISAILANVGDMSASDSAKAIISGVQAYSEIDGYTDTIDKANALIDKYNLIGNEASITSEEVAEGVEKVGSVFADSNTSVDELISLLAAGNRTFQDADTLALGLRTAALRIRSCTTELEAMGEETDSVITSTSKLQEKIKALTNVDGSGGVDILEADGETFRSIYDIFLDISKVYQQMSDVDQSALLDLIAGKNRASQISSVLNNMSEATDLYEKSLNAVGSAQKEYENYLLSSEAAQIRFQETLTETYQNILNGGTVTNILNLGNSILSFANSFGIIEGTLKGIIAIGIAKFITTGTMAFIEATKSVEAYGKALQVVSNIPQDNLAQRFTSLKQIAQLTNNLTTAQLKQVLSSKTLSEADRIRILMMQGNSREMALQKLKEMELTTATNAQTVATKSQTVSTFSLTAAIKGFAASIKSFAMSNPLSATVMVISTAFSLGISAINKYKEALEEARQEAEEAANACSDTASSVENYVEQYQELHTALLNAKGDEEETYNIKQQLLDLQSELNEKYGDEYGKLNLVTDAYKDQTEAIKAYNKESAQTFLNENRKSIETASKKINQKKNYNLSLTGISYESDEGAILKKIAEKYINQGIVLNESEDGTYSIVLYADANSAYETINNFMNDVQDKANEIGDSYVFDKVLEMSSSELNSAKDILDKYESIYETAQMAQIASNDSLSKGYNEAISAVESYNEAVLKSEDPYNDENVKAAYDNLQTVKQGIQDNEEEWGQYSNIMNNVFDSATDDTYEFYNALQNDNTLSEFIEDLKGFSDTDLLAMADDDVEDSFDKLCEAAKDYGLEIQDVIDLLIKLGYIQGEIQNSTTASTSSSWDYSETITQLDTIKDKFDTIDSTFSKLYDSDENIGLEDYSSILEDFSEVSGIEDYIKRLQEAGQDTEKVRSVMEDLMAAYLDYNGILDNVTEENATLIEQSLEEMGIANSQAIVEEALAKKLEQVSVEKEFLTKTGKSAANATLEEINVFIEEGEYSDEARAKLAQLALAKETCNGTVLDFSSDISNIEAFIQAIGGATTYLTTYNSVKNGANGMSSEVIETYKKKALGEIQDALNKTTTKAETKIELDTDIDYEGGEKTKDKIESLASSTSDTVKDYIEAYMDYQEKSCEKGIIDYKEYCDSVSKMLKDMYDNGKISAQDYWDYTEQMLETEKSLYDKAISAVINRLDKEIDSYEKQMDEVEDRYQEEIDLLQTEIDSYEDQKEALQEANDERERQLALENALYNLQKAQSQRTKKLYTSSQGFIYTTDAEAIKSANEDLEDAKLDITIAEIDKAISTLEKQQESLKTAMENEKEALQTIIDQLEDYKDQWNSVADEYENAQNEMIAEQILGADWESDILSCRTDNLNKFKDAYITIQQELADAAWNSANEQIKAAQEAAKGADGSTGSASSVGNSGYEVVYEGGATTVKTFTSKSEAQAYAKSMNSGVGDDDPGYYVKKYGTGTTNARKGLNLVGEDGVETYIDNDDNVALVTKPSFIPMEGGETVLNEKETKSLFGSSNLVPIDLDAPIVQGFSINELSAKWKQMMPDYLSSAVPNLQIPKLDYGTQTYNNSTPVVQNITLTLPNVTNDSGYERLQKELKQMQIDAVQYARKK